MKLGAFSVSLSVKSLKISKEFYEKLGFERFAGDDQHYVIMKNENSLIGLFEGLFENNILTWNPGWDSNAQNLEAYDDVRSIQKHLQDNGVRLETTVDDQSEGPGSITFFDPDGNVILIDQHI